MTANLAAAPPTPAQPPTSTTTATSQINSTKLYVPVITFSKNKNIEFLENLKQGLKD